MSDLSSAGGLGVGGRLLPRTNELQAIPMHMQYGARSSMQGETSCKNRQPAPASSHEMGAGFGREGEIIPSGVEGIDRKPPQAALATCRGGFLTQPPEARRILLDPARVFSFSRLS